MRKKTLLEEILKLNEEADEDWDYEDDDDNKKKKKESYLRKLLKYGALGTAAVGIPAAAYLGYKNLLKPGIERLKWSKEYTGYPDVKEAEKYLNVIYNDYKDELTDGNYSPEKKKEIINNIANEYEKVVKRYPIIISWLEDILDNK